MRIGFVVNEVCSEEPNYTTVRLGCEASNLGHDVYVMGVGDLAYDADERVRARSRSLPHKSYRSHKVFLQDLQGSKAISHRVTLDQLDALMLRNVPSDDYLTRP